MNLKFPETTTEIVLLIIAVPVRPGHSVRNSVNQGPVTLLGISSSYGNSCYLDFSYPSYFLIISETPIFDNCIQSFSGCFSNDKHIFFFNNIYLIIQFSKIQYGRQKKTQ